MNKTLNLAFVGLATAVSSVGLAQTITVAGPFDFVDTVTGPEAALNTTIANAATVSTSYVAGSNATISSVNITSTLTALTWANEAFIRLRNSAFPTLFANLNFSSTGATFTAINIVTPVTRAYTANTLIGSVLPAGSTWEVTFFDSADDGPGPDASGTNLSVTLNALTPPVAKTPWSAYLGNTLPVIYDNGGIVPTSGIGVGANGTNASPISPVGSIFGFASIIPTFKLADDFVVTGVWTVTGVSAFAYQTGTYGNPPASLFTNATIEIWSGNPTDPASTLIATSFTPGDNTFSGAHRVTATTLTNAQRPVMRVQSTFSGLTLNPGTYWVTYQVTPISGSGFTPYVTNTNGAPAIGNAIQRTAIGAPDTYASLYDAGYPVDVPFLIHGTAAATNVNLTGTLNLNDTSATFAFNRNISYSVMQGTTVVASGTVVADASSESFSISVPASATGAATIEWDGSSFLLRKTNINLTGSALAVGSVSVQNGDVDNSGEVDAADIDEVIADFGDTSNNPSDVDVSGEVDAADIDIVIANFGGVND